MNLYLISQTRWLCYDTYDSAVVAAYSEDEARNMHPRDGSPLRENKWSGWVDDPALVSCELIGVASSGVQRGVVLASFNAG